ncbi:MAG: cysteine desulfurase [Methanomassiliicoccales archaeon]|nr:MAG: cysteine desulfurase [Methanomassiliicoccales archaeon]
MTSVYFDNSATTMVDERVIKVMDRFHLVSYGNASSMHKMGLEAGEALDQARRSVARAIGGTAREIVFTSGGTEADNLALMGYSLANKERGKHIITSCIEHHAVLRTCEHLQTLGFEVTYLPVTPEGQVRPEDLERAIRQDTIIVSIMSANNEIGTIQNIREIGAITRSRAIAFHTDAVQSICKQNLHVVKDNIDMLSISAHKFHGPKGVGALFVRKGLRISPIIFGGGQERGLRSSTENVPGIVGMAKAIDVGMEEMEDSVKRMREMRDLIIEGCLSYVKGAMLNGHQTERLCNNAHFCFKDLEGESLVLMLSSEGFMTSTGSACSSRSLEPSHVLKALGLRNDQARGSLRVSLSKFNTMDQAKEFVDILPEIVERVRKL